MRKVAFVLAVSVVAWGGGRDVFAHGGQYRGPGGPVPPGLREPTDSTPPPAPPCRCARPDCTHCTPAAVADGRDLAVRKVATREVRRWGEVVEVRTTLRFRTKPDTRTREAYAPLERGSLLAVESATFQRHAGLLLEASRAPSEEARRDYLDTRDRQIDPLLIVRRGAGTLDLRAFPILADGDGVAVVRAYALRDAAAGHPSLYRTGERYLAVVPLGEGAAPLDAHFTDAVGRRALWFLDAAGARERFPRLFRFAREVPCVDALEAAARAGTDEAWVAFPAAAPSPPPTEPPAEPPPPPREPVDPTPPPAYPESRAPVEAVARVP